MIAIFEGPDGSGKTTLAEHVAALTGATYIHAQAPERHPLVEYTAPIAAGEDYVLDRWHFGEMVYGPLYRGGSGLTAEQFWAVEQYLDDLGAIVILCNGTSNALAARIRARGGEDTPSLIALANEGAKFREVGQRSILPVLQSPVEIPMTADEVVAAAVAQEVRRAVPCD